jgi:hypothetical protein
MNLKTFGFSVFLILLGLSITAQPIYISRGIAGNDHDRKHPLEDALTYGFAGVSAEVSLKKNGTVVCGSNLLKEIYLKPLFNLTEEGKKEVYSGRVDEFLIILTVTSDMDETIKAIETELKAYETMLTKFENGFPTKGKVRIILAGKPGNAIESAITPTLVCFEEVFDKTKKTPDGDFITSAGLYYKKVYDWKGSGNMPNMQYHSLNSMIKVAQKSGRLVRLFAIPEENNAFDIFLSAGADYLEVNDLEKFASYWRNKPKY